MAPELAKCGSPGMSVGGGPGKCVRMLLLVKAFPTRGGGNEARTGCHV